VKKYSKTKLLKSRGCSNGLSSMRHPHHLALVFGGQTATDSPTLSLCQHLCHLEESSSANLKPLKANFQPNKKSTRGVSSTQESNITFGVPVILTLSQLD
jgi:hypothetical protein